MPEFSIRLHARPQKLDFKFARRQLISYAPNLDVLRRAKMGNLREIQ